MAQAAVLSITGVQPNKWAERDKKQASFFRGMDGPLHEVRHMASVAYDDVEKVVASIMRKEEIDSSQYERLMFVIGHLEEMIVLLQRDWDEKFRKSAHL